MNFDLSESEALIGAHGARLRAKTRGARRRRELDDEERFPDASCASSLISA